MTFRILKAFEPVQLGTTAGDIYTAPVSPASSITVHFRVRLVNTDSVARDVILYAVPASGSAGVSNICYVKTLGVSEVADVDIPTLKAGDKLQGLAGAASKVTVHHLSGMLDQ